MIPLKFIIPSDYDILKAKNDKLAQKELKRILVEEMLKITESMNEINENRKGD